MESGTTTPQQREIANLGVLDLTGMRAADDLDAIRAIVNVGTILVPQSLSKRLAAIPMANIGAVVPVPDGEKVQVHTHFGATQISGDALGYRDGDDKQVLVVLGALIITTPVTTVGFDEIIVIGPVFAPEASEGALQRALRVVHGSLYYYPGREQAKFHVGDLDISGAALANPTGKPGMTLLVAGNVVITSTVETLGYTQIHVVGNLFAPKASEVVLNTHITATGYTFWYDSPPHFFTGIDEFSADFLECLPEPVTMVLHGNFTFMSDVTVALLRAKVTAILLNGILDAPKALVPLIQVLTLRKAGMINASDEDESNVGETGEDHNA